MSEAGAEGGLAGGPRAWTGLGLGCLFLLICLVVPPPDGLTIAGWRTLGLALLMASLWASEALPIPATALLPIPLLPLLGITDVGAATAPYGNELVFLFMGGFILAKALERWDLHRRVALHITRSIGTRPARLVLGFMLAAAVLSMWISNTATTVMMLPIAASIVLVFAGETLNATGPGVISPSRLCWGLRTPPASVGSPRKSARRRTVCLQVLPSKPMASKYPSAPGSSSHCR